MKQLIRWPGLIAFVAIIGALGAFWLLLADTLLRHGVESVGTDLVGAEVNLGSADLSLEPLGVRLRHLQVTDPEHPQNNLFELGEAVATLEPWQLLMGQVIVNELTVSGLRLNTPRQAPGSVKTKAKADATATAAAGKDEPSLLQKAQASLPPIGEVLGREELLVTTRSGALKEGYATERAKVDNAIAALPDEKTNQQLQQRYQKITSGKPKNLEEFNRQKQELEQLQKELKAIRQNLEQAKRQVGDSKQQLQGLLAALQAAPGEDVKRLSAKYALSAEGGVNLSRLIFGDKVGHYAGLAIGWYRRLAPMLASSGDAEEEVRHERAKGRYVRFPSNDPTPDFLLRKAHLQAELPFGNIDATLADVTHQPAVIGRPATLHAAAEKLASAQALKLDATFDHIAADKAKDQLQFSLQGLKLAQVALSESKEFPLALGQAASDLSGSLVIEHGELDGRFRSQFSAARFETKAASGLAGEIGQTLTGIDRFLIEGRITGKPQSPRIAISSDLDQRIGEQLKQRLKAKQAEFEAKLRSELQQRIAGPQAEHQQHQAQLQGQEQEIDRQLAENKKMLEAKVQGYKEGAGKAVGDKLKGLKL